MVSIPLRTGLGFERKGVVKMSVVTGVSIPLRTGLGFERPRPAQGVPEPLSQSPYERVSDSNASSSLSQLLCLSLNPLTNGSRIRTFIAYGLSQKARGLNPLTNGSRIRTRSRPMRTATRFTSQSPYERVSDSNERNPARETAMSSLNPLTNGSRIRTV